MERSTHACGRVDSCLPTSVHAEDLKWVLVIVIAVVRRRGSCAWTGVRTATPAPHPLSFPRKTLPLASLLMLVERHLLSGEMKEARPVGPEGRHECVPPPFIIFSFCLNSTLVAQASASLLMSPSPLYLSLPFSSDTLLRFHTRCFLYALRRISGFHVLLSTASATR